MTKVSVELVYDRDCPNADVARSNIQQAFADGFEYELREWDRSDPNSPPYAASYGSPTILINGNDVSGAGGEADAKSCRVYHDVSGRLMGAPSHEMIRRSVVGCARKRRGPLFAGLTGIASVLGMASIPALTCPACWPAYVALLGAAGIGIFDFTPYLMPSIVLSVAVTLTAIGYQSYRAKSGTDFGLGVVGAILILVGRFGLLSDSAVYFGVAVMVSALVLDHLRRISKSRSVSCCEE